MSRVSPRRKTLSQEDAPKTAQNLFDSQAQAPAPGTTYYQLVITPSKQVILNDWPKQRFSQKFSPAVCPGSQTWTVKEFVDGEGSELLRRVFGENVYERALTIAKALS